MHSEPLKPDVASEQRTGPSMDAISAMFLEDIHSCLDCEATAFAVANQGRQLIGCDRLSVGVFRAKHCRILAVSGVDTVDRRSNVIGCMEGLAEAVASAHESVWFEDGASGPLAPQIEGPLQAFIDQSQARQVGVVPIHGRSRDDESQAARSGPASSKVMACLVVEQFDARLELASIRQQTEFVQRHSRSAFANALDYSSLPLLSCMRAVRSGWNVLRVGQLPNSLKLVLFVVGLFVAAWVVPADFTVAGRGRLEPKVRRNIFATTDGVVDVLHVRHGQHVSEGMELLALRDSQLDFEFTRVLGEIQTTRKRLSTIEASRLELNPTNAQDQERYNRLTAEQLELKEHLKSLDRQYGILEERQNQLVLRSPITGQVLTWDVQHSLQARPVRRGQTLLTVADVDGPWILEVRIPDHQVGHLREAQKKLGNDLDVSFVLAGDPGVVHTGKIERVADRTDSAESEGSFVLVTVAIDAKTIPDRHSGMTAVPRIHCGRASLAYVWLHQLIEFVQRRVLF